MIQFADLSTTPFVRRMWKICFGDSDQFIDLLFSGVYSSHNTLVYVKDKEVVASLQMFPYIITIYGQETPFYYMAGLCTLPEHRKNGYMEQLIYKAHEVMRQRGIPLSILIPAEESLYDFYRKYGYEQVFEKDDKIIPLKEIINSSSTIEEAYIHFDKLYRGSDFCVQKTFEDFVTIVKDAEGDGFPPKTDLSAMAKIIDADYLLSLYAKKNPQVSLSLQVDDDFYTIRRECIKASKEVLVTDFNIDSSLLCRLLFGFKTNELSGEYQKYFPQHRPIINLMLE